MKTLSIVIAGTASVLNSAAVAQNGSMMDGSGMWGSGWMGGYGISWLPILLVCIVFVGLVIWIISQNRK